MSNIFIVSDWHFSHTKCWEAFKNDDGSPMRPFSSTEEMDETIIARHNEVVRPNDTVYCLGDVAIKKKALAQVSRLNGIIELIKGNHDPFGNRTLEEAGFSKVHAMKVLDGIIMTHIPLHPDCVERFGTNVHGHLHNKQIMWDRDTGMGSTWHADYEIVPDPRYLCVSVEQTDYRPLSLEEVRQRIKNRQEAAGYDPKASWGNGSGASM